MPDLDEDYVPPSNLDSLSGFMAQFGLTPYTPGSRASTNVEVRQPQQDPVEIERQANEALMQWAPNVGTPQGSAAFARYLELKKTYEQLTAAQSIPMPTRPHIVAESDPLAVPPLSPNSPNTFEVPRTPPGHFSWNTWGR